MTADTQFTNGSATRSRVTAVVVTYNAPEWTQRSLHALKLAAGDPGQSEQVDLRTVVVDNASTDFDPSLLSEWAGPRAEVVLLDQNLGFGRACNLAVTTASSPAVAGQDYVLLVNPDAVVEPTTVQELIRFHQAHPRARIVGGRITKPDGSLDPASCWQRQTVWSLVCFATGLSTLLPDRPWSNPEGIGGWRRDSERAVGVVTGCLLLIDRQLWDELGGFDERFFMYGEDADLCRRARDRGFECWITPKARAVHATGASASSKASKLVMVMRAKATLAKDDLRFPVVGTALLKLGVGIRALGAFVLRRKSPWRQAWEQRSEWSDGYVRATREVELT